MNIAIRNMQAGDIPAVSRLVCDSFHWSAEREGYTAAQIAAYVSERGGSAALGTQFPLCQWLVACAEETIVGVAAVKGNEIDKLYVDPQFLRQGIGQRLFQAAEELIASAGHKEFVLGTGFSSSLPFYRAMGMQESGRRIITLGPCAGKESILLIKALTHRPASPVADNPVSPESLLAREVAEPFLKGLSASAEPIERPGAVNLVFRVCAHASSVIVRVGRKEERTVEESLEDYRKEQWCMEQAHRHGIPVPEILAIGQQRGLAFMVQQFIEGCPGDRLDAHPQDLYRQLGRFAKIIHFIPLNRAGREFLDSGHLLERPDDLLEQVRYNLGELGPDDPLVRLGIYEAASVAEIARILESLLTIPLRFGLCHSDLSPRDVIVGESGCIHLLDWGCAAVAAIPHHDLHELIIDMMEQGNEDESCLWAFAEGYGLNRSDFAQLLKETDAYLLLKSLDVVRWAIDRKPDRIEPLAERARRVWQRVGASV